MHLYIKDYQNFYINNIHNKINMYNITVLLKLKKSNRCTTEKCLYCVPTKVQKILRLIRNTLTLARNLDHHRVQVT